MPWQMTAMKDVETNAPDFSAAAFRDADAAAEWAVLAAELELIYSVRSSNAAATARRVSDLMAKMTDLLPFCFSKAAQRVPAASG